MNEKIDSRDVLPTVSVPTLVLCRAEEYFREASRFIGEHIPGARVAELPGNDHLPWEGDQEAVLDEIERFLSVVREDVEPDRVLATLLFTHLVGSTAKAAGLGDRAGKTCSQDAIDSCAHNSRAFAAARLTRWATASSGRSTARCVRSGARRRSQTAPRRSDLTCGG